MSKYQADSDCTERKELKYEKIYRFADRSCYGIVYAWLRRVSKRCAGYDGE